MGYVSDKGRELESFLAEQGVPSPAKEAIVAFLKRAILTSYRNGQHAPQQDEQHVRENKKGGPSRSRAHRTYKR